MSNRVEVKLGLKDQLSSPLRGVMSGVRTELGSITTVGQSVGSTLGGMTAGFAALAAGIVTAGIAAIGFQKGIMGAAATQTTMISTAGDVANLMGTTYSQALGSVKDIQKEISKMAASLPGETAGYASIANSVTASIALGSKGNLKQMKEDVLEVTKTLGFLAASQKVDMNMAASASNKFVSGSASLTELFGTNDVFQKNPIFKIYLEEQLKAIGKSTSDWQSLDQAVRNKVITLAGKKAISKERLEKLDGTADSLIEGIKTSLFDTQIGIFGFLREVDGLGGATVLSKVQTFLKTLITLSETMDKLGMGFDPMVGIGKGLDFLSDISNSLALGLKGDWSSLKTIGKDIWKSVSQVPKLIATGINYLATMLNTINWNEVGSFIVDALGSLKDGLAMVDWGSLGEGLGKMISGILMAPDLGKTLGDIFIQVGKGIATIITSAFSKGFQEAFGVKLGKSKSEDGTKSYDNATRRMFGVEEGSPVDNALNATKDFLLGTPSAKPLPQLEPQSNTKREASPTAFAPVVNITGVTGDPQTLAQQVMAAISSSYDTYQTNSLGGLT